MSESMNTGLLYEILEELTHELNSDPAFKESVLKSKVVTAIRDVKLKRNYKATSYTEKQIEEDLYDYYSVIKKVALYDYNQIGAEFQSSHNENSTSRTWIERDKLFNDVPAFVKVL